MTSDTVQDPEERRDVIRLIKNNQIEQLTMNKWKDMKTQNKTPRFKVAAPGEILTWPL